MTRLAIPALLFAATVSAQTLPRTITLQESTNGKVVQTMTLTGEMRQIDGRSNVVVHVAAPQSAAIPPGLSDAIAAGQQLRTAVSEIANAFRSVETLLTLGDEARANNTPAWRAAASEANRHFGAFAGAATAYISALRASSDPELKQRAGVFETRVNNVLRTGDAEGTQSATAAERARAVPDFLEQELTWLSDVVQSRAAVASANAPRLYLAATLNHKGTTTPVGLPGYNDIPIGQEIPFTAINLVPTPQDIADAKAAFDESTKLASSFNELKASKANFRKVLAASGIDFTQLENALTEVKTNIDALGQRKNLEALGSDLLKAIDAAITKSANPRDVATLTDMKTQVLKITTAATAISGRIADIDKLVTSLRPSVARANLLAQSDPVQALVTLLSTASGAINLVTGAPAEIRALGQTIATTKTRIIEIVTDLRLLANDRDQLTPIAREAIAATLQGKFIALIQPVVAALTDLRKQVQPVLDAFAALGANGTLANLVVTMDTPPPTSKGVSLAIAPDTTIPITTLNRAEGDVVTLQAWLYQQEPNDVTKSRLVETKTQPFAIVAFGWSTAANVGVVYASSLFKPENQTSDTRTFAPQVAWTLGYRPRGGILSGNRVFDVGLHAVSFDLDRNNQLELGMGVTIGTMNDFLYAGYGIDMTLGSKKYWFVGTRLLTLVQKFGFPVAK